VLAARPLLEELRAHTGESSHLVVLEGNGARFIDSVESPRQLRVAPKLGVLVPAHSNSAGKALLAELSPAAFAALYPRGIEGAIGSAMENRRNLQRELDRVRRRGYATNFDESEQGITAIGAVIRDDTGRAIAGLAVAVPSSRCPRSRVAELASLVREVAAKGLPSTPGTDSD
jgi:DNA-binding IclR family transcriptional regulator